jgi:CubicO group peptidase (beta-lactamase class C family)
LAGGGFLWIALSSQLAAADIGRLMADAGVPGLSIATVHGHEVQLSSYGVRSANTGVPVDAQTVFEAASLGKPVFAYMVLQMVDAGTLSLDDRIVDILPNPVPDDPRATQITVREILSHTTGLPNWRHGKLRTYFDPGTRFSYSGEAFILLQRAVEKITGQPLEANARRLVFEPLGIRSTSYVWQDSFETDHAAPHDVNSHAGTRVRPQRARSASSLQTTAADYARFLQAALTGERLKPETAKLWLSPVIKVPQGCGPECLLATAPELSAQVAWGLGWGLEPTAGKFFQWGDNDTFMAYAAGSVGDESAVVVLTNSANGQSIMPDIVAAEMPGEHPSFAWLSYDHFDSVKRRFARSEVMRWMGAVGAWWRGR